MNISIGAFDGPLASTRFGKVPNAIKCHLTPSAFFARPSLPLFRRAITMENGKQRSERARDTGRSLSQAKSRNPIKYPH